MIDDCPEFGEPVAAWHRVFAWWPRDTYDQGWKWLRFIERRRIQLKRHLDGGARRWWQYRALTTKSVPAPRSAPNPVSFSKLPHLDDGFWLTNAVAYFAEAEKKP